MERPFIWILIIFLSLVKVWGISQSAPPSDLSDNEFAEFEVADERSFEAVTPDQQTLPDPDFEEHHPLKEDQKHEEVSF